MRFSSVFLILSVCGGAKASAYDDATQKAVLAAYKQSGLEKMIQECIEREIPKSYRDIGNTLFPIIRIGIDQKVGFVWKY